MNYFRRKLLRLKQPSEAMREHFDLVCSQYDNCLEMGKKIKQEHVGSFSLTYLGLAYEFIVLDIEKEAKECLDLIPKTKFNDLISEMESSEVFLVLTLVVYDFIKDDPEYKDNYFFQIFEGHLERKEFKFPYHPSFDFPKFIKAWENLYGKIVRTQTISISKEGKITKLSSDEE